MGDAIVRLIEIQIDLERSWVREFGSIASSARVRYAMLALAERKLTEKRVSAKEFIYLSNLPSATAHRMLASLEASRLISRGTDLSDGRCQTVGLTLGCTEKVVKIAVAWATQVSALAIETQCIGQSLFQLIGPLSLAGFCAPSEVVHSPSKQ